MLVNVLGCHIPELFIITMTLYNLIFLTCQDIAGWQLTYKI